MGNTAEGYANVYNKDGEIVGYKIPPTGTPDGGAYTTAEDMKLFLIAIQKNILLNYANLILSVHCPYTREKEWMGIPGLYGRNGYSKNDNCTAKGTVLTTKNALTMGVFAY